MPRFHRQNKLSIAITSSAIALLACTTTGCNKTPSTEALVAEAKQYQQKGDNKAAIIQLKNAIQKNPEDAESRFLLGSLYNETGDAISAEKELRKAISLGMAKDKVLPGLAKALLAMGQAQKVLDETKDDPRAKNEAEMATTRGNAFLALDKAADAKESFDIALKDKPDFALALIGMARYFLMKKDLESATRFSEEAVSKNPKNMDAWLFKGDLLRIQGKIDAALAAYDETLKIKPDNSAARLIKANLEISTGKFDEAKANIETAKKTAPNSLNTLYSQALLDFNQKKYPAALESLQQILRAAPNHMPSVLLAGSVQLALGSSQQAETYLKKYLESDTNNIYARKMLANATLKNGSPKQALAVLAPILKEGQQDPQVFLIAGESYMQAREYAKATEYFEKASVLAPQVAMVHTAIAMSKLGLGDSTSAVTELEKAASLDTKSPQAGILLAMTHLRQKDFDKALAVVKGLEKEQPNNPLVQNLKGGVYIGKEDKVNARASFEKAISLQPGYFPAIGNLAQLDLQENKPDDAKKRFEALLEKDKKNIQAMSALANLAVARGQNEEAKSWFERATTEAPNAIQPARSLVGQYLRMGEKQNAVSFATKQQAANTSSPDFLELLAQTQASNGDKAASLDSYNKLAVLVPDSTSVQYRIALVHIAMQNDASAITALKKALRLDPNFSDAQIALAGIEARKGNFDEAISLAKQIQKQQAQSPVGYTLEGDLLMAQKKQDQAIKAYEQGLSIGKNGQQMIKLHGALNRTGKTKDADARINQWLKDHPSDLGTRMYLAQFHLMNGQNKTAIEQFQTILKADPKNVVALNNIAWAYSQEKDPRALEYAEKAYQLAGDSGEILDTLGWMLVEQGNVARGLPMLQKAISLLPDALEVRLHLAQALIKSGDKAKARKELEQIVASNKPFPKLDEAKTLLKQL